MALMLSHHFRISLSNVLDDDNGWEVEVDILVPFMSLDDRASNDGD